MRDNSLILECSCGGYHYLHLYHFDDKDDTFTTIALVDQPRSFWSFLKEYWRDRKVYVHDVVLELPQLEQLHQKIQSLLPKK